MTTSSREELTTTMPSGPHRDPLSAEDASTLPRVRVAPAPAPEADFELGETIGVGGMGRVVSARQSALDRQVATKFLRDPEGDAHALLREAIVTGRLEHPNIVPVHVLATTTDGVPFFAMKRVEGTPWSQLLGEGRPLIEHLEILVRVCDAVAFAHEQQVVHRDIKPDNVLVGSFGEVYLVDWGLAVSLKPDAVLPEASEADFAGTPAYMAPEMAAGDGRRIDTRSDVYLLGATLYEVLTGRLPHRGATPAAVMGTAVEGAPPEFDKPVSAELSNICRRAMEKDPSKRFESAKGFKQAVLDYLRHREAYEILAVAQLRLDELRTAVRSERGVAASVMGLQAHHLFSECRFGFEQVLRMWPGLEVATSGLRQALLLMVEYELSREEPRAARIIVSQLNPAPNELLQKVEAAEVRQLRREARLFELERDAREREIDLALAEKRQFSLIFSVLTFFGGLAMQAGSLFKLVEPTTRLGLLVFGLPVLSAEVFSIVVRRSSQQNHAQRRLLLGLKTSAWSSVLLWFAAFVLNLDPRSTMVLYLVVVASNWAVAGALWQRRGALVAAPVAVAALLSLLAPQFVFAIAGLGSGLGFFLLGRAMRTPSEEPRAD